MLLSAPVRAQISGASSSNTPGSSCTGANNADGFCGSATSLPVNTGVLLQSRYAWNINADVGIFSTRDTSGNAQHNMSFNATAPGGYRLDISTQFVGAMGRRSDATGCNGRSNVSGVTGSSNIALSSGSLSVADPGEIPNGGGDANAPFSPSSSATIFHVSNGVAQSHSLTFTWNGQVRSNSCEASVRLGLQNGTTTACDVCGYPGSPSRDLASDGHFVTVTYTSLCGNGVVDSSVSEQCDQGAANGSPTSCCTSTCQFRSSSATCRASVDVCDVAENCTGSSGVCPADGFASSSTVCRAAAGVCDVAENCTGSGPSCPADGFASSSTVCRAAAGVCDVAENCTGSGPSCPADGFASSSTVCRAAAGVCDVAENCTGSGPSCPADGFASSSTVCRAAAGVCDVAENCTGSGPSCPADGFASSSTVCRAAAGVCDVAENCTGSSAACPTDGFVAAPSNLALGGSASQSSTDVGTADRAIDGNTDGDFANGSVSRTLAESEAYWEVDLGSIGSISNIEIWNRTDAATAALSEFYVFVSDDPFTGTSIDDSLNQVGVLPFFQTAEAGRPSLVAVNDTGRYIRVQLSGNLALTLAEVVVNSGGTSCRSGAGGCDAEEFCDGSGVSCPADAKLETECRAAAGVCDVAENCDGVSDDCPADGKVTSGTECRAAAGVCDVAENCDGVSAACPADGKVTSGTECRAAAGVCDVAEQCDGASDDCPADGVAPNTTVCRAAAGVCDVAENCDGVSAACPADGKVTSGTECRAAAGVCDVAEQCDGASDDCPADALEPNGAVCRPEAGDCDIAETCDGSSVICPADAVESAGTECRAAAGVCDVAENCDGVSAACPANAFEPATTECRPSAGTCDPAESCTGSAAACPANAFEPAGTVCRPAVDAQCDIDEQCDGSTASCPADVTQPDGLVCDDGNSGTSGETCIGGLCGCLGDDLDGDSITDNCDPEDAPLLVKKALAWATGSKLGRIIVRGTVPTGTYGPADFIDISNGLTLAMVDANEMSVVAPFDAGECVQRPNGLIRCNRRISSTKKWKLILKPIKSGGVLTGDYQLKSQAQGFDINNTLIGPVTASISHGFIDRVGSKACTGGPFRLVCR